MHDPEIQFRAPGPGPLADALRDELGGEGRKPPRKRVHDWIRAGRVRVEGEIVEDPAHRLEAGDTVDLGPGSAAEPPARSTAPRPEGILHLDRHLLVATYEPPVVVRGEGDDVSARLARALEEAAVDGLRARPVPTPDGRVGGLVAAALSPAAEVALAAAFAAGRASLTVVADVDAPAGADLSGLSAEPVEGTGLRIRREAVSSVPAFLADLDRRALVVRAVPGPGPATARPLLVHVAEVHLGHPRTGRALSWRMRLPPTFGPGSR